MAEVMPAHHVVLVHGAWQGAWVWDAFAPRLRARGATVDAIDLPGARGERDDASFAEQVDALIACIDAAPDPLVLIGHSGGATVASQAAEHRPDRIVLLVMLAGILLPSGGSLAQVIASLIDEGHDAAALAGIRPHLEWSADRRRSRVPPAAAIEVFLHDCDPVTARAAAARLVAQSEAARAGVPWLTPAGFGRVPRLYVEALRDRSIVPVVQRRLIALTPGTPVVSVDAGHAPQVACPDALDGLLAEPIARAVAARDPVGRR